jgi:hypothetical protein
MDMARSSCLSGTIRPCAVVRDECAWYGACLKAFAGDCEYVLGGG